jgi:hypothetical protein
MFLLPGSAAAMTHGSVWWRIKGKYFPSWQGGGG